MTPNSPKPVSSAVQQYWDAVARRLRIESQDMAGLISHLGERGRANEGSLSALLGKVLPPSVRMATGEVIDHHGTVSAQMDTLVLSNTTQPVLFGQTEEFLFPVESVLICVEVKSTLTKAEVADIAKKVQKHRKLTSTNGRKPTFVVFSHKASSSPATVAKWFFDTNPVDRPQFFLINDAALFGTSTGPNAEYRVMMPYMPEPGEQDSYPASSPHISDVHRWKPIGGVMTDHVRVDHGVSMLLFIRAILKILSEQGHADIDWLDNYLKQVSSKRVQYLNDTDPTLEAGPFT